MKRVAAWTLLLIQLITLPANATTYYLNRTTGNDNNDGLAPTTGGGHGPLKTVAKRNNFGGSGSVFIWATNDTLYDTSLNPWIGGQTDIGDSTTRNVRVPGITFGKLGMVVNGFKVVGGVSNPASGTPKYWHMRNTTVIGTATFSGPTIGGFRIENCRIGTGQAHSTFFIQPTYGTRCDSISLVNNSFNLRWVGTLGSQHLFDCIPDASLISDRIGMRRWTVSGNRCTLTVTSGQWFQKIVELQRLRNATFHDNLWFYRDSSGSVFTAGGAASQAFVVRDSIQLNTFVRDSVIFHAMIPNTGNLKAFIYSSGNQVADSANAWRYCLFQSDVPMPADACFNQEWTYAPRDSFYMNTVLCNSPGTAYKVDGSRDSSFWFRNTVVNTGTGPALTIAPDDCSASAWGGTSGRLSMHSNLLVSGGTQPAEFITMPGNVTGGLYDNHNLLWAANGRADHALSLADPCTNVATQRSVTGGAGYKVEGLSTWGSPAFEDSSFATFDPDIGADSYARATGLWGTACGSRDYVPAAPATVADLLVLTQTSDTADLLFTAPGASGTTGTATSYDFRYSTTPITQQNFTSCTSFAIPAPGGAGNVERVTVTGLTPHTTYYFALTATNGVRTSGISNVADTETWPADTVDPFDEP